MKQTEMFTTRRVNDGFSEIVVAEDISARRHGGNAESRAANERKASTKATDREKVLIACHRAGGVTCRELANEWGVPMHRISARFSELKAAGLIDKIGVREHSAICQAKFPQG